MHSKKPKLSIEKQEFIDRLSAMTPEEISKFIEEKGKPPKLIDPLIFFSKSGVRINPNQEE